MIFIFIALITYSAAILVATFANRQANVSLVALIVNVISVFVPAYLVSTKWHQVSGSHNSKSGLIASIIGGLLISVFTLSLGKAYELNNVAVVGPVIFGGAIVITSVLSMFIFKEKILPLQAVGLFLVAVGLGLVVLSRLKS